MRMSTELRQHIWAMERRHLEALATRLGDLELVMNDAEAVSKSAEARAERELKPDFDIAGGVAVIPIRGVILKDVPWYYGWLGIEATSTAQVRINLDAALGNEAVQSILLRVESPGGTVAGVQDLADAIYAARDRKPVKAYIEDLGASAAYWLASQAQEITANSTAEVGSIGVYCVYWDQSKAAEEMGVRVIVIRSGPYKGMGVPGDKITDEQIAVEQEIVNDLANAFIGSVARGRGMEATKVAKLATGRTWLAADAVGLGLIDQIDGFNAALSGDSPAATAEEEEGIMPKGEDKKPKDADKAQTPAPDAASEEPKKDAETPDGSQSAELKPAVETTTAPSASDERERAAAIIEMASNAGMPQLASALITEGVSADVAGRKILKAACDAGKLGGDALNDPAKDPRAHEDEAASEEKLKAEYNSQPEAIRRGLTFEAYKEHRDR